MCKKSLGQLTSGKQSDKSSQPNTEHTQPAPSVATSPLLKEAVHWNKTHPGIPLVYRPEHLENDHSEVSAGPEQQDHTRNGAPVQGNLDASEAKEENPIARARRELFEAYISRAVFNDPHNHPGHFPVP